MVQIDIPAAFGASCFLADMASRQLRLGRAEYYFHTFTCTAIFQAFCFSWIPLYFLMNFFGWETTHMWWHADSVTAYPFFIPVFVLIFWLAAGLGFLTGTHLARNGRIWTNRGIWMGIGLYCLLWIFVQPGRSMQLGTYSDWQAGAAPWFYENSTFLTMFIISMLVWLAGIVYFAALLRGHGRHLDPTPEPTAGKEEE